MLSPKRLLNTADIRAQKALGQNFLTDSSTAQMIVQKSCLDSENVVLEIGAGLGALTISTAKNVRHVYAVEKDIRLVPLLQSQLSASGIANVTVINKNILNLNLKTMFEVSGEKFSVMGNLPYNISSQVLVYLISNRHFVSRAVLMFQKELAERICASPGGKDYGRLTVMLQYCATVKILAEIKATAFFPRPKVDSSVIEVRFQDRPYFAAVDETFLFSVIKAAFGKRRKTLKNALTQSQLSLESDQVLKSLETADINPSRRAETLSIEEFVHLSNILLQQMQ
ncbi:MAG: 16S rRNA (adenine(1518)-N(6)/adenine(1519)-N(6))-dimethyltransferase RsmA [Desulfobacterales bacterium]